MRLHHDTFASAAVFYHRFYQIHSFKKFNHRYVTATCCLFLAGKVEETPKKCKGFSFLCLKFIPCFKLCEFAHIIFRFDKSCKDSAF